MYKEELGNKFYFLVIEEEEDDDSSNLKNSEDLEDDGSVLKLNLFRKTRWFKPKFKNKWVRFINLEANNEQLIKSGLKSRKHSDWIKYNSGSNQISKRKSWISRLNWWG